LYLIEITTSTNFLVHVEKLGLSWFFMNCYAV